jgi:ribonuclease J
MEGSMLGRGQQGYSNEEAVSAGIQATLQRSSKICFLFCSAQNIDRIVSAYKACLRTNTTFVIDIYCAYVLNELKGKFS